MLNEFNKIINFMKREISSFLIFLKIKTYNFLGEFMKKVVLILLLVVLLPFKVYGISASSAIAMDLDTGRVLYGYNINEKRLIASTTKIMTALIAIEKGSLNSEVTISDIIYKAYGSAIYLEVGEKITLKDLLYGLMLRSGNDSALAISEHISGSVEEFVFLMNEYATNIGMKNTTFVNPHGLENDNGDANISTALDMAKLTKYAMENSTFREIFKTKKYTTKSSNKSYVWHNKNKLLSEEYITGGKTGFTEKARRTLVSTGSKNNINIVVVTLNDPNDWDDHKSIYNNIFNKYISYQVLNKNKFKIDDEEYYKDDNLYIKNDYYIALTKDECDDVVINYNLMKLKDYVNDDIVGYAEIKLKDNIYHKEPIYINVKKEKEEKLSWWQKFRRWLFKW